MIANRPTTLIEAYRPSTLDDFVGNDKARSIASAIISRGAGGRALFISGPTGTGKTTLARIIAESLADPRWATIEVDAGSVTVETVRDWEHDCHKYGWLGPQGQTGRAYIVNEAHGLRAITIRALLVWLEELPSHCVVIFTTTLKGQDKLFDDQADAGPLIDRCTPITLTSQGVAAPFADRLILIAEREGIQLDPKSAARIVKDSGNSMRGSISQLEALALSKDAA